MSLMFRLAVLGAVLLFAATVIASYALEDGQTYWRKAISDQYGISAPSDLSVPQLIELQSALAKAKVASDAAKTGYAASKSGTAEAARDWRRPFTREELSQLTASPSQAASSVDVNSQQDWRRPFTMEELDSIRSSSHAPTVAMPRSQSFTPSYTYTPPVSIHSGITPSRTSDAATYLGKLSSNEYDYESISNPYGTYGNPYGQNLKNEYSPYGSPYSSKSPTNPYATNPPQIYGADGKYLGKLSTNKYDYESIANPYGPYGSKYGNNLVNPYSQYGSKYSPQSWTNPYTYSAPKIYSVPQYGSLSTGFGK